MKDFLQLQLNEQLPKPGKTGVDWYLFYILGGYTLTIAINFCTITQ